MIRIAHGVLIPFLIAIQFVFFSHPDTCVSVRLTEDSGDENDEAGHIRVVVDVPNVKIAIDGQPEGLAHPAHPLERRYFPIGVVVVEAKTKGYPPERKKITIKHNETAEVEFNFNSRTTVTRKIDAPPDEDRKENSPSVETLLEKGDDYFKRERYTTPYEKNAFGIYKAVLEKDPGNSRAREKINDMMKKYLELAEEYRGANFGRMVFAYQQYLFIAEYALKVIGDPILSGQIEKIKNRLNELELKHEQISRLDKIAEACFKRKHYTTPADENAFDACKAILEIDPENDRAIRRIRRMINNYIKWGNEDAPVKPDQAAAHYRKAAELSKFVLARGGDQKLERKLAALDLKIDRFTFISRLFEKADTLFDTEHFVTPEKENALRYYLDILTISPENQKAIQKIGNMMEYCRSMGEKAYSEANYALSKYYYGQYLKIIEIRSESEPDHNEPPGAANIRSRLQAANHKLAVHRLAHQKEALLRRLERYETLKRIELQDKKNVADELISVLADLIETMRKVEILYEELADFEVRMKPKVGRVKAARKRLEKEIGVRMNKAA